MKAFTLHIKFVLFFFALTTAHETKAACSGINAAFTINQTFFCGTGPYTLNFTNTTSGSSIGTTTFDWYQNGILFDNTSDVLTPVTQNISAVGTYNFMLVVNDSAEPCSDTAFVSVTIVPAPNASYTFTPNNGCAYQDVDFTNTSTGTSGSTTYDWDFGPGPNSNNQNPTYAFNSSGSYNVTLVISNGPGCSSSFVQVIDVIDAPTPSIVADDGDGNSTYCLFPGDNTTTETVVFSNLTTNAVSYEWDFGDGSPIVVTSSLADLSHDYTSYGTFTVTMTATSANGCQTSTTVIVVFEKFVSAALTLGITEYSGCTPHDMSSLANLSVNATTFVWDFGDGTVITTNDATPPSYSYTTAGTYTITLTASNSCNSATATISPIIIIDGPTANFTPSITNGCAPQIVTFTNSSTATQPANNYQWDMGNGSTYINTTTPPAQTYPTQGFYDIQLIAGNACGHDTIIQTIFIDTIPTIDLILDPITGCSPLNVDPTATLLTGTNVNWQWYIDGVYYSNAPNDIANQNFVSLNPNDSTLHTIQVTVSNICGSDSEIDSVYVNPPVIANFSTIDTICLGDQSIFTNLSTGTNLTFNWDFGDGSLPVTDTNTAHTFLTAGDFTVTLTVDGICGTDTYSFQVSVLEIPIIDITAIPSSICSGENVQFINNSSTSGTYFWDFGPNGSITSSTLFDPGFVAYISPGTHVVSFAIDYSGCQSSDTLLISVNPIPIPDFLVSPTSGCTPLTTSITNNTIDTVGNEYNWSYGNGLTSSGYNANNQIYNSGILDTTYNIQLIVETAAGCTDSLTQIVTVYPLPDALFTILDDTICMGDDMLFANNSTGASNYLWDFDDGVTSTTISPSHSYNGAGIFQVTLVAYTTNGCTDTTFTNIFIDSIPTAAFSNSIECFGGITTFTNNSTGSPVSYEWDFGDGSPLDNSITPTHLYGASGNYLVTLTVTNGVNCSNSIPQIVQVNDVPIADFSWSQTCLGQSMNFTDLSLNTPIGWSWNFGDSGTSLLQNPSHLYADTGIYTVSLIVSGGSGCLDSISFEVYLDSIPTADFSVVSVCANDMTQFSDNSIYNPDTYFWQFGDGGTSVATDPIHTYASAGIYPVTLQVQYASNGCTNTITQNIEAYPRTTPGFSANTACLGDSTFFTDVTTNIPITWEWDFGDASPISFDQHPSHLYTSNGLFNITLITSNAYGCYDTLTQQAEVYGLPIADYTHSVVCEGATTQFTNTSTGDISWQWDFGDLGNSDLNENPTYTFSTNGSFSTELVVMNNVGCYDTISYIIVVNPNPIAGFYSDTACFGYITSFSDTSINAVDWFYDFGDLNNAILSDPIHTYSSDGIYSVEQIVTNIFGCMDSTTIDVLILPQPEAGFMNNTVCALDVVDFTDTTTGAPTYWDWDFGDGIGTSSSQNPSYTYVSGGIYDVTLISGNTSGCLDTTTIAVEVYTNPTPNFEADTVCFLEITSFNDLSSDIVPLAFWDYDFGDGINTSSLQNPTYIYQAPGIYPASLTVTNIYGCNSTITVDVVVNNIPVAEFTYDTICWGSATTFSDNSTGTVNTWSWDFGDGNTSAVGPIVTHTYAFPGTYLASMEVDGGSGCTDIIYHSISVIDVITPLIGAQDTACLYEDIQFQDLSFAPGVVITSWNWDFGDGLTSNIQNPIHNYSNSGVYIVTLNVQTSTGCSNTGTYTVSVFDPPVTQFEFTIPCEGQPTIFTDSSYDSNGSINSWSWDFGDGGTNFIDQSPEHEYLVAGSYPVTLIIGSSNGCYDTLTQSVQIYPSPTADFVSGLECGGTPVDLINTSVGNIVDFEWIFNGNVISNNEDTSYIFPTDTDTHPVSLIVTTDLGCIDTVTHDVITHPVVNFDFGPFETAGCPVMEVSFFENSTTTGGGGIINWLWDMGDSSLSFDSNPVHFYEDEGYYYVSLQVITAEDCIYYDTLSYAVIVYPQPIAAFNFSPTVINILDPEVLFNNTSEGAQDVEWYFGDFDYSNEWNPVHLYGDTGYYEVIQTVYNEYGCSDTAYHTLHVDANFVIYIPNTFTPNGDFMNDLFNVSGYGMESFELLVFNRWGNLIKTITDLNDGWDGTYNGNRCQDGVYTWKLRAIDYNEIPHSFTGHVSLLH